MRQVAVRRGLLLALTDRRGLLQRWMLCGAGGCKGREAGMVNRAIEDGSGGERTFYTLIVSVAACSEGRQSG